MAYEPTIWKDRIVEKPKTYTIQNNPDGSITLIPAPGVVTEEGTPVNANNLNKLEQGLKSHEADNATNAHLPKNVGLDKVPNYPVATKAQAEAGTDNASLMTPLRTLEAILKNASHMNIITGSYAGTGSTRRLINLGKEPLIVIITGKAGTNSPVWFMSYRNSAYGIVDGAARAINTTYVETPYITTNGFFIGRINTSGTTGGSNGDGGNYTYIAIMED